MMQKMPKKFVLEELVRAAEGEDMTADT